MRAIRILITALMVATVIPLTSAHAVPMSRVETVGYEVGQHPLIGVDGGFGAVVIKVDLPAGPENFLELSIEDDTGLPVPARISQDDVVADICGKTETPVKIRPNYPVQVTLHVGRCPDGSPGTTTKGTVTAEFLKRSPESQVQVQSYSAYRGKGGFGYDEGVMVASIPLPAGLGRRLSVEIKDESGLPVTAAIRQGDTIITSFCGKTEQPASIDRKAPSEVLIFTGPCGQSGGPPTRGTVRATFAR